MAPPMRWPAVPLRISTTVRCPNTVDAKAPSSTKTIVNPRMNNSMGARGFRAAPVSSPTMRSPVTNER